MKKPVAVTQSLLKSWGLPAQTEEGDKESRGRVLIIGGAHRLPGAAILSATAALRVGAGKLQMAVSEHVATAVAVSMPEALVVPITESKNGKMPKSSVKEITVLAEQADSVVVGPGLMDSTFAHQLMQSFIRSRIKATLVIDAEALRSFEADPQMMRSLEGRAIVTPHAGEMASILKVTKSKVQKESFKIAQEFSNDANVITVLKGNNTFIASPHSKIYKNTNGNFGLATSGSGDVLAGTIAGFAARGASPIQAAVWGVYMHAAAGDVLEKQMGGLGFLAREISGVYPQLLNRLSK